MFGHAQIWVEKPQEATKRPDKGCTKEQAVELSVVLKNKKPRRYRPMINQISIVYSEY
jgi:hypothetical protein